MNLKTIYNRYETLIESSLNGIATVSKMGIVTFCNSTFLKLTGYSEGEIVGKHISKLPTLRKKNIPGYLKLVAPAFKGGKLPEIEFEYITKSKETRFGKANISVIKKEGKVIELMLILRDITDEKNTKKDLEKTERTMNLALQSAPITLFSQDLELKYTWIQNLQVSLQSEEVIGKLDSDFVSSEHAAKLTDIKKRVLKTGTKIREEIDVTVLGNTYWYDLIVEPIRDTKRKIIGIIGITWDITERMKIDEVLQEGQENLRNAQNLAKIGSWKWTVETDTVEWSDELYLINGRNSKLPPPSYAEHSSLYTPESWKNLDKSVKNTLKTGKSYELDLDFIRVDGTIVKTNTRGVVHYDASGKTDYLYGTVQDITERKQAEKKLTDYQIFLKSSLESPKDIIILAIDKDYNYLFFNQAHKEGMLQSEGKEIEIGMNMLDCLVLEVDKIKARNNFYRALNGDSHSTIQEFGDKKSIFYESFYNPIINENNEIIGATAFARDITERKQTEKRLKESENRYKRFSESGKEGIVFHEGGIVLDANHAAAKMFGVKLSDLIGMNAFNLVTPGSKKIAEKKLKTGSTKPYEIQLQNPDGTILDVEVSGKQANLKGKKVRVTLIHNITERKKAEEKLKNSQLLLRSSLESPKDIIILAIDKDYNYLFFNQAHKEVMIKAYEKEVKIGMSILDCITSKVDRDKARGNYNRALNGEPYSEIMEYGVKSRKYFESFYNPIINENKEIIGVSVFSRDITIRKEADNKLKESEKRYKTIFDTALVSLWEEDYSKAYSMLEDLKAQGVIDIRDYLTKHPEFIGLAASKVKVLDVNEQTLKIYKAKDKKELMGSLDKIFIPETFEKFGDQLIAIFEGHPYFKTEFLMQNILGEKVNAIGALKIPTNISQAKHVIVSLVDITERKRTDNEIINLAKFPSENPNPVIRISNKYLVLYANEHGKKLLKKLDYKKEGRIPKVLLDLIKDDNKEIVSYVKTSEIKIGNSFYGLTFNPVKETNYTNIYGRDITEQKRVEKALKKRQEKRDEIATLERNRIESNIHDSVSQTLFSTRLIAEVLPDLWKKDKKEALKQLEKIGVLTKESLSQLRRILLELKPDSIIKEDLEDLIGQLGNSAKLHSDIQVKINTYGKKKKLSLKVKEVFYGITQEALNNIIKHSGASKAKIVLRYLPKKTSLEIKDNGNGFIRKKISHRKLGLYIMEERAKEINASFKIESRDKGTNIILIHKS